MKKVISIVLVLALVLMVFVACKSEEETILSASASTSVVASEGSASSYTNKYSIGCIYSEITGDFWGIVYNGCMKALTEPSEYGIKGYCIAPANSSDYTLQMELIDAAKVKGVNGIVLSPVNADSIGAYVTDNFKDTGFPIVVIDRSLSTDSKWVVSQVMADTWAMGEECGKMAIEATGGKGKYILIGLSALNTNWANRSLGAIDYISKNAKEMSNAYPSGDGVWWALQCTDEQTFQFIQDQCTAHPNDPLCFITSSESRTNIVISAISELSARAASAPLTIIGYDFSNTGYTYLKNGLMYAAVGQNPYKMGYTSTYTLINYLETGTIDSFITVPYTVVTLSNMQTDEVQAYFKSMNLTV